MMKMLKKMVNPIEPELITLANGQKNNTRRK